MASKQGVTDRNGRYAGIGDLLHRIRVGGHAPKKAFPFSWLPTRPDWAHIRDGECWWDMLSGMGEADPRFTISLTEAGAGESTITYVAGGLKFTTDAGDNDAVRFQHLMAYTPAAKKRALAYARVQISDVTQSDFFYGFYATQTDPVGTEALHGAYFKKDDGAATMVGRTNDAGAAGTSTATLNTLVNDTEIDLLVGIDPTSSSAGTVYFCTKLASANWDSWAVVTKTTDFPAGATRFSGLLQAGEAVAKNCTFSRAFAWWEA